MAAKGLEGTADSIFYLECVLAHSEFDLTGWCVGDEGWNIACAPGALDKCDEQITNTVRIHEKQV